MSSSNRTLSGVAANNSNINQGDGSVVGNDRSGRRPPRLPGQGPGGKPPRNVSNWIIALGTVATAVIAGLAYLKG